MVIKLDDNLQRLLKFNLFKFKIKIVDVKDKETLVEIKGQSFTLPFVLDKTKKYLGVVKGSTFQILEKATTQSSDLKKKDAFLETIKELITSNYEEKSSLTAIFSNRSKNSKIDKFKTSKNFYFNKDDKNFIFFFELPFFNQKSKVFININNKKETHLSIYSDDLIKDSAIQDFTNLISQKFMTLNKMITVNITSSQKEFLESMSFDDHKVDITI